MVLKFGRQRRKKKLAIVNIIKDQEFFMANEKFKA